MSYFEVLVADSKYHGEKPLTYSYDRNLAPGTVVSVPLKGRMASGFVYKKVNKPSFATKQIKSVFSAITLPLHLLELADWLKSYYGSSLGQALRQFAPTKPSARSPVELENIIDEPLESQTSLQSPLTTEQKAAIKFIKSSPSNTILLHGETGSGKTRVYLELAKDVLAAGKSVLILTPEIALTGQLSQIIIEQLRSKVFVLHSQLTDSERKKIWKQILEATDPIVVLGPRSALFSPIKKLGLIVVDEAHEAAYKQEQSPRYQATRVASQLGSFTKAKVVLGTATPSLGDFYVASHKNAITRMVKPALGHKYTSAEIKFVDIKDRANFTKSPYLSNQLIDAISTSLLAKKQIIIYLNRRGSARLILCNKCGWQYLCPNCDIPLIYHGDVHEVRCHTCGYKNRPPTACPVCKNPEIIFRSVGTKSIADMVSKLFPSAKIARFDTDTSKGSRLHELYNKIHKGEIDILVGTQILAKGLDLPKLGLVGIVAAESSLTVPDFSSEERTFQLLYQIIGRVGRGHGKGQVILQSYNPTSPLIEVSAARDYSAFYNQTIGHRKSFRFPPFAYLLKLSIKKTSSEAAQMAAEQLKSNILKLKLPIEVVGPTPSFYGRKGKYYYWQLVIKTKDRKHLLSIVKSLPQGWSADLDPINLL